MSRLRKQLTCAAILTFGAFGIGNLTAGAAEVLVNGNLELGAAPPPWTVTQTVTGLPGAGVNATEQVPFANNPPESPGLGLFIRPFAGNEGTYAGQNRAINFIMSQTIPQASIVAGNTYTLTMDSYFAGDADPMTNDGYSGGVTTLDVMPLTGDFNEDEKVNAADYVIWRKNETANSPLPNDGGAADQAARFDVWRSNFGDMGGGGGTPSPTDTTLELRFLNISGVQLGSTHTLDLRTDRETLGGVPGNANDAVWRTQTLTTPAAPTGTRNVQVTFSATDMVANTGFQNLYIDNFTLKRSGASSIDILNIPGAAFPEGSNRNGNLNLLGAPVGWNVTENITGPGPPAACTSGCDLIFYRDFADHTHYTEASGQQGVWLKAFTTPTPDGDASILQTVPGTAGAGYTFSAWSAWEQNYSGGIPGSPTETFIKMEFLDGPMGSVLGTQMLDLLAAGQVPDANDGGPGENGGTGAEENDWRQFSVNGTAPVGTTHVRVSAGATDMFFNTDPNQSGFFDDFSLIETLPGSGAGSAAVPEPATYCLLLVALVGGAWIRRRRS